MYNDSSQNIPTCYDEININEIETHQSCKNSLETLKNNKSNNCVTHSTHMVIYNSLYNNMNNIDQTSNLIVGLSLELKDDILLKNGKHLIVDTLSQRIDNYKKIFTNMKDKSY